MIGRKLKQLFQPRLASDNDLPRMKVNPFTLAFRGELEEAFQQDYFDSSIGLLRASFLLGTLYYTVFAILDAIALPEVRVKFALIRFALVCPIILTIFLLSFTKNFQRWWQFGALIATIVSGLGIVLMTFNAPTLARTSYYPGMMLVLFYCYMLIKLRFVWATLAGWTIVALYLASLVLFPGLDHKVITINLFFLISANILGMFGGYALEYYTRRDFFFRHLLTKESEKIGLANLTLQERVDEKTKELQRDIQKRKEIEEALREREQHLELLIDNIIDVVWQMDLRLNFTYVSPSIFRMTGYTQEEWIGTNLSQHATGKEYFKMARQALKAIKNYHEFQHINIRAVMLKKDGQEIPVEIIGKLLLDKNGLPKGFQGTTRDVTARARAEEQVERHLIQLQALREIERTINSTLEADQILNIMMTELEQIVPYASISVQMLEGDCLRIAACRGLTHAKEIKETLSFPLLPSFPNSQVIEKQAPMTFADITREYPHFMEEEYTTVMGHVRSWLGIPLVVKGESIGMFTLDRYQVRPFTEDEVQAAQSFANRAAIALENARLFSESQRRADEFRTLYDIGQDLSAEQELTHLLKTIAKKAKELLAVEISWVYLHDPKRDDLQMAAIEGQVNGYDETVGARMDVGKGVVGRVAQDREMLIIEDYRVWEKHQPKYVQADFTSILSVPMLYSGELVGVLVVSDVAPKVREFTQDEIEILSLFATSAAGAVHSARLFNETQQRLNQLQSLRTIDKAISGVLDRDLMLRILLSQIVTQLEADAACVLIYNPHLYLLEYAVGQGFKSDLSGHITLRLGEGYAGQAAMQRQIIQIENVDEQKPRFLESPHLEGEDFHTYFGLPLIAKGQLTGVLEVFHRSPFQPDQDWLEYLDTLAGQVAIAIDNINMFTGLQQAHQELDLAYDQTLKGWAHALEYRDMETEGHSRRVTDMTVSLARTLGMQGKKLIQVRRGALLHDIGKMAVPDDILQKPGSLDDREWQIMRQHPVYAYEMLKSIDYLYPALDIPHCHHEKWDGSGYPRGLKGEQIPLAARIFAVVDVWDALTSDRPYREAWPEQKALNHIRQQAGKHFDPQVVDKFFETLQTHQD